MLRIGPIWRFILLLFIFSWSASSRFVRYLNVFRVKSKVEFTSQAMNFPIEFRRKSYQVVQLAAGNRNFPSNGKRPMPRVSALFSWVIRASLQRSKAGKHTFFSLYFRSDFTFVDGDDGDRCS